MDTVRVLIVDDHPLIREGLYKILETEPRIQVVAEAGDGQGAIKLTRQHQPDVVLMDIQMPGMDGLEAAEVIKGEFPDIQIIILTVYEHEGVVNAVRQGLGGYMLKDVEPEELIKGIFQVVEGKPAFDPYSTKRLLRELNRLSQYKAGGCPISRLTSREKEVLSLIAAGESNRSIANKLFISEKTVKNHITNIFRKIKVQDRTQAAIMAIKSGLVEI